MRLTRGLGKDGRLSLAVDILNWAAMLSCIQAPLRSDLLHQLCLERMQCSECNADPAQQRMWLLLLAKPSFHTDAAPLYK